MQWCPIGIEIMRVYRFQAGHCDTNTSSKHWFPIDYLFHIWQAAPQLSCSDTIQIWMCFEGLYRYDNKIIKLLNREINEQSFSNPIPELISILKWRWSSFYRCPQTDKMLMLIQALRYL